MTEIFKRKCGNCAHWHMNDKWCHSDLPATAIGCKNWEPNPELREEITELTQKELVVKEKSWVRGYITAELQLMCEIAIQALPECKQRFLSLKDTLERALNEHWLAEDSKK